MQLRIIFNQSICSPLKSWTRSLVAYHQPFGTYFWCFPLWWTLSKGVFVSWILIQACLCKEWSNICWIQLNSCKTRRKWYVELCLTTGWEVAKMWRGFLLSQGVVLTDLCHLLEVKIECSWQTKRFVTSHPFQRGEGRWCYWILLVWT